MDEARIQRDTTRLMRGSFLRALYINYPHPTFKSVLSFLAEDFGLSDRELEREIAYLKQRGWITAEAKSLLGRPDMRLELTADGVDVARGIDPDNPILTE